jgi:hypothetical protein
MGVIKTKFHKNWYKIDENSEIFYRWKKTQLNLTILQILCDFFTDLLINCNILKPNFTENLQQ